MVLESVNFHFWPYCNFHCIYCFVHFKKVKNLLSREHHLRIIDELAKYGTIKLNLVGGEPTLCPYLGELIERSKDLGMITGVVSNGLGITQQFVEQYGSNLDIIGLSLDSGDEAIQKRLGRGNGSHIQKVIRKSKTIKEAGINLKINSVITRLNYAEDMTNIIELINPNRWKVFQVLEIQGQNSKNVNNLSISGAEFQQFVKKHKHLNPIVEDNEAMIDSYVMIDAWGRFFRNTQKIYTFSNSILKVGVINAINELRCNLVKPLRRNKSYVW